MSDDDDIPRTVKRKRIPVIEDDEDFVPPVAPIVSHTVKQAYIGKRRKNNSLSTSKKNGEEADYDYDDYSFIDNEESADDESNYEESDDEEEVGNVTYLQKLYAIDDDESEVDPYLNRLQSAAKKARLENGDDDIDDSFWSHQDKMSERSDESYESEEEYGEYDLPHKNMYFCSLCSKRFSLDDFSAVQKKIDSSERFCLRHTTTSAFGNSYTRPINPPSGMKLKAISPQTRRSLPPSVTTSARKQNNSNGKSTSRSTAIQSSSSSSRRRSQRIIESSSDESEEEVEFEPKMSLQQRNGTFSSQRKQKQQSGGRRRLSQLLASPNDSSDEAAVRGNKLSMSSSRKHIQCGSESEEEYAMKKPNRQLTYTTSLKTEDSPESPVIKKAQKSKRRRLFNSDSEDSSNVQPSSSHRLPQQSKASETRRSLDVDEVIDVTEFHRKEVVAIDLTGD